MLCTSRNSRYGGWIFYSKHIISMNLFCYTKPHGYHPDKQMLFLSLSMSLTGLAHQTRLNPFYAEFISGNMKVYLHLQSILETERVEGSWNLTFWMARTCSFCIWVRSWNCGSLVTRFCYQLIAKPGNKTIAVSWPDPYSKSLLMTWWQKEPGH